MIKNVADNQIRQILYFSWIFRLSKGPESGLQKALQRADILREQLSYFGWRLHTSRSQAFSAAFVCSSDVLRPVRTIICHSSVQQGFVFSDCSESWDSAECLWWQQLHGFWLCSGWISLHPVPLITVAMYVLPLELHVCTSNPMTLNEYHITSSKAVIDVNTFFIPTCKGTKNIWIYTYWLETSCFVERSLYFCGFRRKTEKTIWRIL